MRTRLALLTALVALLGTACIRVNVNIEVNDDGSGQLGGLAAFNFEGFEDIAGAFGEASGGFSQDELCSEFEADTGLDDPEFDSVMPYEEDGFCGIEFSDTFTAGQLDQQLAAGVIGEVTLRREGGGWYFEMPFDDTAIDTQGAEGLPGFDSFLGDAEYVVRVKLPGRQVDHNGDFVDDQGFVVWDVDILDPPTTMFLRTEPGDPIVGNKAAPGTESGGNAGVIILIVVLALAALGLAAWFLMRSKKEGKNDGVFTSPGDPASLASQPTPSAPPGNSDLVMPGADPATIEPAPVDQTTRLAGLTTADAVSATEPPTRTDSAEPAPTTQDTAPNSPVIASPTPEQATGSSVWDPVRRAYVQWEPTAGHWLLFDDATQQWVPET